MYLSADNPHLQSLPVILIPVVPHVEGKNSLDGKILGKTKFCFIGTSQVVSDTGSSILYIFKGILK